MIDALLSSPAMRDGAPIFIRMHQARPAIASAYATGKMQPLLPGPK